MHQSEYDKLLEIFEKEERFITPPKKNYSAIFSESESSHSAAKCQLFLKCMKPHKSSEKYKNLEEQYSSIIRSIPKDYKQFYSNYLNIVSQNKKIAIICSRELRRSLSKTSKTNPSLKSKKINRELNGVIKKSTREEKGKIKKEEKEEEVKKKREEEEKEELRQKRKFNYLMSQTEAFASFFLNKKRKVEDLADDNGKIQKAAEEQLAHISEFDQGKDKPVRDLYEAKEVCQPKILKAKLKDYQLKGLNWLVNLYSQGINGILADDMGLGKTIQSIALLGYLFEVEDVTGPFLIITPASTLHNWHNEFSRFLPSFKVLSYWGNLQERKELRKKLKKVNAVVTSYQVAVSDEAIMNKIKWQYMILDEAQAIKSISSLRWKILLGFKARNRLLLTGTPIQNNMQELWSLLHFIMPTLFDSLLEFSEWFSKDIENKVKIEDDQISKLHTILKPFMLRRHKDDIKDEIGTKEIIDIVCEMSNRQRALYNEILASKMDYENTIMQLKKVCNHPDLFEKLEPNAAVGSGISGENGYVEFRSFLKKYIPETALAPREECHALSRSFLAILDHNKEKNRNEKLVKSLLHPRRSCVESQEFFDDIIRRKKIVENNLKRFRFVTEKIYDKHYTTNIDHNLEETKWISSSKIDRQTYVPPLNTFISDSGKLSILDHLLKKLKEENHRVLIYFQMTKMMDLFEEYLVKREYYYLRLDGSSKIIQRKELVEEWQKNNDAFIFILSTRAGGVGINLTAADTVIFYDSDWNPTIDQQAMDRVHRLGQTKDVTVYRLITKNSVEERIMEKANKKDEMQKIVIKGKIFEGSF